MKNKFTLSTRDYIREPAGKRHLNEQLFTVVAPKYDLINRLLSFGRDRAWKDHLVRSLPQCKSPRCLDLASGTGDIAFRVAERFGRAEVTGIDITAAMIELARKANCFENVHFVRADICDTELPDNSVDIVTGGYALRNAPDLDAALTEIHRIMKPGATAAFLDFSKPSGKILQKTESFMLSAWGGFWGIIFHRNPKVYTYIAESLARFPDTIELRKIMEDHGFTHIQSKKHFLFFAETITCRKA